MKKVLLSFGSYLLYCATSSLYAQSGIVVTGGNASGANGSVSYSIGQVDFITSKGSGGTVTAGIQQPFEIFILTGVTENCISLFASATAYPNPATQFVTLKVEIDKTQNISYQLYDQQGKLLLQRKIVGNETQISLAELSNAIYIIKVLNNNKEVKSFKITKNQ